VSVGKLVTKVQIVGLWKQTRRNDLQVVMGERTLKKIALQVIATTATRKDIENQNVVLSRMTMQTT